MKIFDKIRKINLLPYLLIFYAVGIAGIVIPQTHELFRSLVPLTLLMNVFLLFIYHGRITPGFAWKAAVLFLAGILVEVAGVHTGWIFGSYEYGPTLGPRILHTPLLIGVNWIMLVYISLAISSRYLDKSFSRAVIGAALMVVYDFSLEPAAIRLSMWDWGGGVPMQNYIAWFIVSFVFILFADRTGWVNKENKIALPLFFIQILFFIVLDVWILTKNLWG